MSVSVPRKGVLIVRLLGQTVGRLDYSSLVYPSLSGDGAMSIGGAKRFADVRRENFALMANEAEMRPALALGRLDAIASKILRHAEILAKELATDWPSDIYGRIVSVISSQLKQIRD